VCFHYLVLFFIITLFSIPTAAAKDLMDPIIVTATKIKTKDTKATYASEIYNRKDIERSGAVSLYDFLNHNTSTAVMPSYGNTFNQLIDIRGFGLTDGFKNVAITVNGRRLNNIDSVPQKLSDLGINNIDRIEITKGSGSVVHGDGATGGSIQIYTRDTTETNLKGTVGNYGINTGSFTTGLSKDKFMLSASGSHYQQDGFSDKGPDGIKDRASSKNYSAKLRYFPTESSELFIEKDYAHVNVRYPNALALSTFLADPDSNFKTTAGLTNYSFETSNTNNLSLGGNIELTPNLEVSLDYTHQDKVIVLSTHKQYHSNAVNSSLNFRRGHFEIITGVQTWQGKRRNTYGTATKTNTGVFVQTNYDAGDNLFSAGGRRENVSYSFDTKTGSDLLTAYDLGFNRTLNDNLSIFSNFNYAFLAPDVDRFFNYDGEFNGFISPTRTQTLNLGLNHVTQKNKLKATVFGMKLKKEQFYNPKTWVNTNFDKSHKYGFELQNTHNFNNALSTTINYAYTQAIIDRIENFSGLGCSDFCDGKFLPGVSDHNITLGINYKPTSKSRIVLAQNYRSEAYALDDFSNSFNQKNSAYTSTDVSYSYAHKTDAGKSLFNWWPSGPRQVEFIVKVENLFEQTNGLWLKDDAIYPTKFTRNMSLGTKLSF